MSNGKTFLELWRDTLYNAHVNFLRKKNLYEEWNKFKSGKNLKQDDYRLMSEFIKLKDKEFQQA
ncbi:MAG: hypothetical protein IJT21_03885 [Synergistaceae bacterium]|nr:hypothetical protein [Synergistaceae bacterium]